MSLHPSRFDLIAKYLYIKSADKNLQTNFFKQLYHNHLITFNSCIELPATTVGEQSIAKTNITVFMDTFNKLIENIKHNGYDERFPIPVGKNGVIINGAHRLVTSYYYNVIPKTITMDETGNTGYNYDFFLNRQGKPKLTEKYADAMALEYVKHNPSVRTMIIYPSAYNREIIKKIKKIINEYGYIYYHKFLMLTVEGVNNLIKELYRGEEWIGGLFPKGWSPGGKASMCVFANGVNPVLYISICMNDVNKSKELKEKCRVLYNLGKHSLHMSDYTEDTFRISSALLNKNSVHFLNNGTNNISNESKKLLEKYFKLDITEDYCLTSSLILEMYGLRKANDIDYLHKDDLKLDGFGLHSGKWLSYYGEKKDDIIYNPDNYFYFNGLKFVSLEVIKKMKQNRNEKKDITDLQLINKLKNYK
jgi:hypothetical protein